MRTITVKFIGAIQITCMALALAACVHDTQRAKQKYFANGKDYLRKGKYGDASIEFRNALRLDPRFVEAYYQLAQVEIARRDWSQAYAALEKTVELSPERLDARLDRGCLYLAARQFDKAEDEANFILMTDVKNVAAYQLLGASLIGQRKPDQALSAFFKVTELLPNDPSAFVNVALVEISLGRFSPAERHLKQALAVDPKDQQAYVDLVNFYRLQNRIPEAQQIIHEGLAKNATWTTLYINWAALLSNQGQEPEANAILAELHRRLPDSADAFIAIGDFYYQRQRTDLALSEYRQALSTLPESLDVKKRIEDVYLST